MNKLIPAIGITVVSAYCLHAANNKLDPYHLQIVAQQFGSIKTKSDGTKVTPADVDAAKLNLIQTNSKYENLLDRQRINDAPITKQNYKQYSEINTQVIYNETDKIIWNDKVTKYVIDMPVFISSYTIKELIARQDRLVYMGTLHSDDSYYPIYFVPDSLLENARKSNKNQGIHGGFFMFKFNNKANIETCADKIYTRASDEIEYSKPAYIFVDDIGKMSPVPIESEEKQKPSIFITFEGDPQPDYKKVLARRVEFKKLVSSTMRVDQNQSAAFNKVLDNVCGPRHRNRLILCDTAKEDTESWCGTTRKTRTSYREMTASDEC